MDNGKKELINKEKFELAFEQMERDRVLPLFERLLEIANNKVTEENLRDVKPLRLLWEIRQFLELYTKKKTGPQMPFAMFNFGADVSRIREELADDKRKRLIIDERERPESISSD